MSDGIWLECVKTELLRHRLPRQEVARLVAELSDHFADAAETHSSVGLSPARGAASLVTLTHFTEEHMSMDASVVESLGSPAEIAQTAVREFRRRKNLLSRSRLAAFCTFVLLPLPALCLAWIGSLLAVELLGEALDWFGVQDPSEWREVSGLDVFLVYVVMNVLVLAPAAGVAALFGRLARKTAFTWRWGLAACLLVAFGTGLVTLSATFSEIPGKSTIMFGVGIGKTIMRLTGVGQFLIPLATGFLVLRRQSLHAKHTPAE